MHECPAPSCQVMVPRSRLMCASHWRALPQKLRAAINLTWRNRGRNGLAAWSANVIDARRFLAGGDADG